MIARTKTETIVYNPDSSFYEYTVHIGSLCDKLIEFGRIRMRKTDMVDYLVVGEGETTDPRAAVTGILTRVNPSREKNR